MTPAILEAIRLTSFSLEECLDLIRTAVEAMTVSMALSLAAFMVWPDSVALGISKEREGCGQLLVR